MIKKLITKLFFKYAIQDLVQVEDMDQGDRQVAFVALYHPKVINLLKRMLVADTKEMMKKDWTSTQAAAMRYGMFLRTNSLINSAKQAYEQEQREQPVETKS